MCMQVRSIMYIIITLLHEAWTLLIAAFTTTLLEWGITPRRVETEYGMYTLSIQLVDPYYVII